MKIALFVATIVMSLTSQLHAQVLTEVTADSASGAIYSDTSRPEARECVYTLMVDPRNDQNVRIFLNSDEEAGVNFSFSLPKSILPLQKGFREWINPATVVSYGGDGVLRIRENRFEGMRVRDRRTLEFTVSSDLMQPESARAVDTVAGLFRSSTYKDLNCNF